MRALLCVLSLVCLLTGLSCGGDSGNPPPTNPDGLVDVGPTPDAGAGE